MSFQWRQAAGPGWKKTFRQRIELHRQLYEGGGNPLQAWSALLYARALGEQPPAWVMEYLAGCAAAFHNLQHASSEGKKIKPNDIAHAVGMVSKGAGTVFPNQDDFDGIMMAVQVQDCIDNGLQQAYTIANVAEDWGITKSTVRRAWKRTQARYPELFGKL